MSQRWWESLDHQPDLSEGSRLEKVAEERLTSSGQSSSLGGPKTEI